jgi:arylsulfatase
MNDLSAKHPDRVRAMENLYAGWAARCGVIPRDKILELMKAEGGTAFWEEKETSGPG